MKTYNLIYKDSDTPTSLFRGELIPVSMNGNPTDIIARIVDLLRKGAMSAP